MADWIFNMIGFLEAGLILGMLWLLARYDRDHPVPDQASEDQGLASQVRGHGSQVRDRAI